jgi:hypothetical protein
VLLAGSLPFTLLGLAAGFVTSGRVAPAVLNAVFIPMAVASGLWMPLEFLADIVQRAAPLLPTYHLAQLGLGLLDGDAGLDHVGALALTSAVAKHNAEGPRWSSSARRGVSGRRCSPSSPRSTSGRSARCAMTRCRQHVGCESPEPRSDVGGLE